MFESELREFFQAMLKRDPNPVELMVHAEHTVDHVRRLVESGREYKLLNNPNAKTERISYEDASGFWLEQPNPNKYVPVILGNGKVFAYTSAYEEGMSVVGITHKFDFDTLETYRDNVYRVWDLFDNSFVLSEHASSACTPSAQSQNLNMSEGYFRSSYQCTSHFVTEGVGLSLGALKVQKTVRAMRQYPYTFHSQHIVEKNRLNLPDRADSRDLWSMRHRINSFPEARNSLYTLVNISGVSMLTCECQFEGVMIYACVAYKLQLLENDNSTRELQQTAHLEENEEGGTLTFRFRVPDQGRVVVDSYITLMTTNDFSKPDLECKRISLAVMSDRYAVLKHSQLWNTLWRGRLKIEPAMGINETERASITKHNAYIKSALYGLYSKIRDDVNPDSNPLNMSVIDDDGSIFWEGEMHVVPLMLVFNPKMAKIILNFRHRQLENAKSLALAYGYKGAKYPYVGDTTSYTDTYWSCTEPLYIHNTALVGINTWNYYRATTDIDWLYTKGYKIIKNTARFLLDMLDYEYFSNGEISNICLKTDTLDMNGRTHSSTSAFLMYMVFLNLKYALEATYELNYTAQNTNWYAVYNAMTRLYRTKNRPDMEESGINPIFVEQILFQRDLRDPGQGVDVHTNNGELHFTVDESYVGFAFGGETGRTILLDPAKSYRFRVHGVPLGLYQQDGNEAISESADNIAGYYPEGGLFDGGELRSFKGKYMRPYFGTNAFDHEPNTRRYKVIKIDSESGVSDLEGKREEYLMMQHFYSRELFNLVIDSNERVQVIKNTLDYFMHREDNHFNRLNEAALYGYLSQKVQSNESQQTHARMFDQILLRHIDETTRFGWGVDKDSAMGLFAYVCGLMGMHPRGAINQTKTIIESFGVGIDNSSVLPTYWTTLSLNTYHNKSSVMRNVYVL